MKQTPHPNKTKVRHADIAREAEASIATVDRVLNARPGVSPHTANRIWDAIQRLEGAGNTANTAGKTRLRFDFILPSGPNVFWQLIDEGAINAGEALRNEGVEVRRHLIEGFNPQALVERIRAVSEGSDGLAVVALENPLVREAVNQCHEAGTPVVTIVSNLSTPKKMGYVGLDNRAAGRTAGYLMGRFLGQKQGELALFEGSLDLFYRDHQERDLGFRDVLRELFPNLTVVVKNPTHDDHEKAYQNTQELLADHPNILGIYNVGGGIRGNARALEESGKARDVVLIGHELTTHSRKFLIDGTLDAVIDQNPAFQAREAARALLAFHRNLGEKPTIRTPHIGVFFRENLP